jgi:hypothetical protein
MCAWKATGGNFGEVFIKAEDPEELSIVMVLDLDPAYWVME